MWKINFENIFVKKQIENFLQDVPWGKSYLIDNLRVFRGLGVIMEYKMKNKLKQSFEN